MLWALGQYIKFKNLCKYVTENHPCITCRELNYMPQIKHVVFPPLLMISYQLVFMSPVMSILSPPASHMDAFKGFLPWKDEAQLTSKGWPWGIHRRNWGAVPHNDMHSIWIINTLWTYMNYQHILLLKGFPLKKDLWSPDHGGSALALPMAVTIETGLAASLPHHLTQTNSGCHLAPICFLSSKCLK